MKIKYLAALSLIVCSNFAFAEYSKLAEGATIKEISSNTGNSANFFIRVSGGTGPCTGTNPTLIIFPLASAGNEGHSERLHDRAFTIAMTAYATGDKVEVGGYDGVDCNKASRLKAAK